MASRLSDSALYIVAALPKVEPPATLGPPPPLWYEPGLGPEPDLGLSAP